MHHIDFFMHYYPVPGLNSRFRNIGPAPVMCYQCGFFDGAAANSKGGAGVFIAISKFHVLSFKLGCGPSTNTRAELMALWSLLVVAKMMGLPLKKTHGDSLVIINWAYGKSNLSSIDLSHWCAEVSDLIHCLAGVDISHVYKEHN